MQLSNLEVWFQRPKDIVRKLLSGDLDLGIVGLDTVCEYGQVSIKALNVIGPPVEDQERFFIKSPILSILHFVLTI